MLLPRSKQARNMICAPHRARKAADSTAAADARTLRRRYLYYITSDGCKGSWMCVQQTFSYAYLEGSNLLQTLTLPNNMQLTQGYEEKRNLLTEMLYTRGGSVQVTRRSYAYDALGRPYSRDTEYPQKEEQHTAAFSYNPRSELTNAQLEEATYAYNYDNIGNRITAQEAAEQITYAANALNQYTQIDTNGNDFTPEYDANGNQTLVRTATGIWKAQYNAQNCAVRFESMDGSTIIDCAYDYRGRRFEKKVTTNGTITLRQRYLYRGYLQIAAIDLQRSAQPALWYITWDPTQPTATRPLALQKDGTWYTYGWDLTKNICEVYGPSGFIRTTYTYTPYGTVTADGDVDQSPRGPGGGLDTSQEVPAGRTAKGVAVSQAIQWSSEYHDTELALIYYNYRYYNPQDGRWTRREPALRIINLYQFILNKIDYLGLVALDSISGQIETAVAAGDIKGLEALIEMLKEIGHIALAQQATKALESLKRKEKNCKPCIPPAGSRFCLVAPPCSRVRGRHKTDRIGHVKVWIVRQDNECGCHLNFEKAIENTTSVPSNCTQIYMHPTHDIVTGGGIV